MAGVLGYGFDRFARLARPSNPERRAPDLARHIESLNMEALKIGDRGTFYPHSGGGEPVRAEVLHVWSDTCVNLNTDDGTRTTSVFVYRAQPGESRGQAQPSGYYFVPDAKPATVEHQIAEKASKAPRVTPEDVEAAIASEHYFTAADGARFGWLTADHSDPEQREAVESIGCALRIRTYAGTCQNIDAHSNGVVHPALGLLTFCVLVLRNGFTVTGESACASPANFDAEIGRKVARANAVAKIWPLLGFRLRDHLAEQEGGAL